MSGERKSVFLYTLSAKLEDALFIIDTKYLKAFLSDVGTSLKENSGHLAKNMDVNELCYFWMSFLFFSVGFTITAFQLGYLNSSTS